MNQRPRARRKAPATSIRASIGGLSITTPWVRLSADGGGRHRLVFLRARRVPLAPALALAGSLAFLLTYYNLVQSYQPIPMRRAPVHRVLLWAYVADRLGWFFLGTLVAIAQKETILIVSEPSC